MNDNLLEILVALGVDNETSRANINNYIRSLKNLDDINIALNVDGARETNREFNALEQQILSLQSQITRLNNQLRGVDTGISPDGIERFTREVGNSIRSVDELKRKVQETNGDLTLSFKNVKTEDGLDREILTAINATVRNVQGDIEKLTFRPILDSVGNIQGLEQVSKTIQDFDVKDFDKKAQSTRNLIEELGRQGYISAGRLEEFRQELNYIADNKSVRALQQLDNQLKQVNKSLSFDSRQNNALVNLENQSRSLLAQLDRLEKSGILTEDEFRELSRDVERVGSTTAFTKRELEDLNVEFKGLQTTINQLGRDANELSKINTAITNIDGAITRLNNKLQVTQQRLGSNLNADEFDRIRNTINSIDTNNLTSSTQIPQFTAQIQDAEKAITQLTVSGNNLNSFNAVVARLDTAFEKLERTGYSTTETLDDFRNQLTNLPTGDLNRARELLRDINSEISGVTARRGEVSAFTSLSRELGTIEAQLERTRSLYARTFDPAESARLNNELQRNQQLLRSITETAASGGRVTTRQIDELRSGIADLTGQARQFNAQATTAVRNSTGLVESLATAFQKFPIWMIASTTFYGTARAIGDITEKVIELDTALTDLRRVSDGFEFEFAEVVSRGAEQVTDLSGRLNDYLNLVTEFARTGKTIDESFDLANTTQTLLNISDLNAEESVNALTAAMIAFNITAEDSVRIADKLNEVN
jgi:predicted  nucleic acid-binding Zn-ribbon protein